MADKFGPFGDPRFWKDVATNAANLPNTMSSTLKRYGEIPGKASDIAEAEFPNSARDSSMKNAFRHALGTGMLAQEFGAGNDGVQGAAAALLAKTGGYAWESFKGLKDFTKGGDPTDTLHDFNANAIGANHAIGTNQAQLINSLRRMASQSVVSKPPSLFEMNPGYMTRSVQ